MQGKDFLSLADLSTEEILRLNTTAKQLKAKQKKGVEHHLLKNKSLAMVFQKPSNRTRISFEVGMYQLGGKPLIIRPEEIQLGERESIADVARVMCRYVDAVMLRVLRHTDIVEFAKYSSTPTINGLSDLYHPCQAMADLLTIDEHKDQIEGLKLCYVGDGNNVCNSLILLCNKVGMKLTVSCPEGYDPTINPERLPYEIVRDPKEAVSAADVVYTDTWTSMGQEEEKLTRLRAFEGYAITSSLLDLAQKDVIFLHCLPAHRGEEVDNEVLDDPRSVVFDQAENRLHAQKSVLASLMGGVEK